MPLAQGDEAVLESLIETLRARQKRGVETYGTPLQTFNGRRALRDALFEASDLAMYLMQEIKEREKLEAKVAELEARLKAVTNALLA